MTLPSFESPAPGSDIRIVYLAPRDVLVARVARKCMMHLCEALTALGTDVELVSLRIRTVDSEPTRARSVWDVYGIESRFRLTMIPTLFRQESMDSRVVGLAVLVYRLVVYPAYAYRAYRRPGRTRTRPRRTVFYSRNYGCAAGILPLRWLLGERARVILEVHVPPQTRLHRLVLRLVDGAACQSVALQRLMVEKGYLREDSSVGRHGGYSPALTDCVRMSREDARRKLGWDSFGRVACYTGKVFWRSKEIELIVQMAELLVANQVRVVIVGGRADHVQLWEQEVARRRLDNVHFIGFVAPSEVPVYQMAADVLLLYYPSGSPLNDYRSPGKLFEYMAANTPAVVSDYLSIREVIRDGENGLLVPPDRPELLAGAVRRILDNSGLAKRLAEQASADARHLTWTATATATISLVDRLWHESP